MTRGPRTLTEAEYHTLAEFRATLRRFLAFSERAARAQGLTPAQHQLLLSVRGSEAAGTPPSISDLADHLQLRLHSTGELVERAARRGLVERSVDPDDARRTLVTTTEQGRRHLEELSVLHRRELRQLGPRVAELLAELGPDHGDAPG